MKLYTFPGAPNPRRVHIFLAEKGIDVPFEKIDIMSRQNRTPEFLEKNVMGGLPVLELDDGSHIAESVAICRYFEALQPEPALFGRNPKEIGIVDMWLRRIELNFMGPVGQVWIHGSPLTKAVNPNQIAEAAEFNRGIVRRYLDFLDEQLASREFLAGEIFSIADVTALCTLDFAAQLVELPHDPARQTNLDRWHKAVSARPSATA